MSWEIGRLELLQSSGALLIYPQGRRGRSGPRQPLGCGYGTPLAFLGEGMRRAGDIAPYLQLRRARRSAPYLLRRSLCEVLLGCCRLFGGAGGEVGPVE